MRTTLTLENDVVLALNAQARQSGVAVKALLNEALRRGLQNIHEWQPHGPLVSAESEDGRTLAGVGAAGSHEVPDWLDWDAQRWF